MKQRSVPVCAACQLQTRERICMNPSGKGSKGCPTLTKKKTNQEAMAAYHSKEVLEFARQASIQEASCYAGRDKKPYTMHPVKPRMLEICEFAHRMKYKKLGLLFCMGLAKEAAIVDDILRAHGFDVTSVVCKAGCVPKEEIGLTDSDKIYIGEHETMCNPILQAMLMNEEGTDFNVLLGLCVGHDSLVFKFAEAPTTVLAVKDRVTGHNPLGPIYTSGNYGAWVGQR